MISQIAASKHTIERRLSRINADIEDKLQNDLKNFSAFSFALDESTYLQDKPQLDVFVCTCFDLVVKKELLDLNGLKKTKRGVDIENTLDALTNAEVPLNRVVSVAADGASAMVGSKAGLFDL